MQKFRVNPGEAQKLYRQLFQREDDKWDMLVEGEEHDVSDSYDLRRSDNRMCLYNIVRKIKEGGHDYKAVLGPDTMLNDVSFQKEHRDTCNCIIETIWCKSHAVDSHPYYGRQTFPHASHQHCEAHAHLKDDHVAHHHEVHRENWHKEDSLNTLAEHLGVKPHEIKWKHDEKRRLVLHHPRLAGKHKMDAHSHLNDAERSSRHKREVVLTHEPFAPPEE